METLSLKAIQSNLVLSTLIACLTVFDGQLYAEESSPKAAEEAAVPPTDSSEAQFGDADPTGSDADDPIAGHSYHGEVFNEGPRQAAYLMPGTGAVRFPVDSPHPQVQNYINQGVGQLHGFWYFEAERTFRQAAALDPDCAAAYWGMAMANTKNRKRAKAFIEQAVERKDKATSRVQRYIEALDALLNTKESKEAANEYINALEKISYDHPDDIEAKAFIAVHLWEGGRNGQKIRSHLAVDALIGEVLAAEPMHPAHHYRIHLWDREKPERALASAALCGQSAPSIAHMWHMPGHIYSRLKRYDAAVWQQEASARTDHAQMMRDKLLPDQIHNFAHNNEWLIRNLIFVGRISDAVDLSKNMVELPQHPKYNMLDKSGCSADYGRKRLLQVLKDAELWQSTLRYANTPYLPESDSAGRRVEWLRAVGRSQARLGYEQDADATCEKLEHELCQRLRQQEQELCDAKRTAKANDKSESEVDKAVKKARRKSEREILAIRRAIGELKAYQAARHREWNRAVDLLQEAEADDAPLLARWQRLAGQHEEALRTLTKHVESHERETLPLAQLVWLQWELNDMEAVAETMDQLRKISSRIDLRAPPFSRLAPIASRLEWPRDWRLSKPSRDDVGQRPPLDSLGPFRWQPTAAPDWSLPTADQGRISLSDYHDRPVIVIFYLGWGCLHCAEQLQAFGPRTEDFRAAGIDIVAISSDDADGLKMSLESYDGHFPFPLAADSELQVFRQYRAFDDFEDQPLHGTFLVDPDGHIRWHDIGYEPFMDHEFLLQEARRLLAQ